MVEYRFEYFSTLPFRTIVLVNKCKKRCHPISLDLKNKTIFLHDNTKLFTFVTDKSHNP